MPAKNKRSQGQKKRQVRESNLPPNERSKLLNDFSQTQGAVAARAARPREDLWTSTRRKKRVQVRVASARQSIDVEAHPLYAGACAGMDDSH